MLSIVIPAYNEEKRLRLCLEKTVNYLKTRDYTSEIIVVSDGSTDNTARIARSYDNVHVIEYSENRGKGYALKRGIMQAAGDMILFMDSDYAVPIETAEQFIKQLEKGYDIVIGARHLDETVIVQHQSYLRELAGKMFGKLQKAVLKIPYYDTQCGFKLFTKQAAHSLFPKLKYDCSYFDAELIYLAHNSGYKIKEMPVKWTHDGFTTMPVGPARTVDLLKKLFKLKSLHMDEIKNRHD